MLAQPMQQQRVGGFYNQWRHEGAIEEYCRQKEPCQKGKTMIRKKYLSMLMQKNSGDIQKSDPIELHDIMPQIEKIMILAIQSFKLSPAQQAISSQQMSGQNELFEFFLKTRCCVLFIEIPTDFQHSAIIQKAVLCQRCLNKNNTIKQSHFYRKTLHRQFNYQHNCLNKKDPLLMSYFITEDNKIKT